MKVFTWILLGGLTWMLGKANAQPLPVPALRQQGTATQLVVGERPWLILGGELGNSSAANPRDLNRIFPKLRKMGLNTALVPVYWELLEPEEGKFDFTTVDAALQEAKENGLRLVLLWFGAWKNSMSCYAPLWFKQDYRKYPRVLTRSGKLLEMACAYDDSNLAADCRAFCRLMQHLAEQDHERTVVMIQVENEIGMIPEARDYCRAASREFAGPVPEELMQYLKKQEARLHPVLLERWKAAGQKMKGTWTEVFGEGLETDEIFTAWGYARYVEQLARAGKQIYPLPMYLNAALNSRGRKPGEYPAGGPLDHLIDIWHCGAPSIDLLAPDIYDEGYTGWCARYKRPDNPLFIPEIRLEEADGVRACYAFGEHDALGFSPFSIEDVAHPEESSLVKAYGLLHALLPLLAEQQGKGRTNGLWFDGDHRERRISRGDYTLVCRHDYTLGWTPQAKDGSPWPETGGLLLELAPDEYLVAGSGIVLTFENARQDGQVAGIGRIDEVEVCDGKIVPLRRLNGDQTHQGRHLRIPAGSWQIQRIRLYRY